MVTKDAPAPPQRTTARRLPALDSLRAFEAVDRHRSFTKAAGELHVTQSAVSQRVRSLELELGVALFRRTTCGLEPTDEGIALAAAVRRGLAEIASGLAAFDAASGIVLKVSALPSLPPDRPSVAVLPFANMSRDPDQEYFSDGIADDLVTELARSSGLFVAARQSAFALKGTAVDVREAGAKLGARYVLEGSVRRAGERVRITAQLADTATGWHLWAERYDRVLTDVFAVQDEIARSIVAALRVRLLPGEEEAIRKPPTGNVDAYQLYLRGRQLFYQRTEC